MPKLNYGLIYDFRNPEPWWRPWPALYESTLDHIEIAESLGFDEIWLTEHHFAEDGYLPSLLPVAAAIAIRSQRIRIGTNALLAALHHPLRVAEDAAVVDILSNGRLDLGLTLGFRDIEFKQYGLGADFMSRVERFKQVVHALQHAYSNTHTDQPVRPAPIQKPHPPIYLGANAKPALRALAPLGLPLILIGDKDRLDAYRDAQSASGLDPSTIGAPVQSLGMFLFVDEQRDTAWATVQAHARYAVEQDRYWAGKSGEIPAARLRRLGIVGTPAEVAEQIVQRVAGVNPQQVCFFAIPPGMAPDLAMKSLRLFTTEVRPMVDERLGNIDRESIGQ
jgi:alkanesulfonate monooxygenase SsuD/methylene tetrahydromethanopterin reductase-like flavin-dependent oxidoreductase (luciferase family)